ncbi:hypothetical protein [Hazenella coriacea]|uniref:Uncharacterized protein n=1 Tax=Hazenella coriacea TaxID=1179467 RepID=A0A4R3LC94_9BACL|nr:hypothetical protein [Hazenella coriacea]TCS96885.1 hypothetical protein EDD58_101530 [Hazenella coriacea]
MLKRIWGLSVASMVLLTGAASAATAFCETTGSQGSAESGLVSMNGQVIVSGSNNGSGTAYHYFKRQINYFPDETIANFSTAPKGSYSRTLSVNTGRYYVNVSGRTSWTKAVN